MDLWNTIDIIFILLPKSQFIKGCNLLLPMGEAETEERSLIFKVSFWFKIQFTFRSIIIRLYIYVLLIY